MPEKYRVLILGAGLAGLSAAWLLKKRGIDFKVLDSAPQPGGTLAFAERSGFHFDAGIHVLHTQDREILSFLVQDLGLDLAVSSRRAFFVYNDKIMPYPFQVNSYCLPFTDRLRVFWDSLRPKWKSPHNYEEFLKINFGATLSRYFFAPYTRKFWTVDPGELTLEWVDQRVPLPLLQHRLQGLYNPVKGDYGPNPVFYYPRQGGMDALARALAKPVLEEISCNTRVESIFPLDRRVYCEGGQEYCYDYCITTLPLPLTVNLLQPPAEKAALLAAGLRYTAMLCLNIALRGSLPHNYHWVYFPERDEPMARVHFPGNMSAGAVPPGYSSLQIEIPRRGGTKQRDVDSSLVDSCLQRLKKLGLVGETSEKPLFYYSHQIEPAYVIHDHYRAKHLPFILEHLVACGLIPAGRFGLWGYHWMHDSISSGKEAAAMVAELQFHNS